MSLSLGVRTGGQIKIGDDMLTVSSVARDGLTVRVNVRGREYQLSDEEKTEVLPDVYVFCGVSAHTPWGLPFRSKLAFDAPRVIQIDRIQIDRTKENSGMPLKLSAQAKRVVSQAQITPEVLDVMVSRATVMTHKDGNRRYHDWLLLILGDRLVKIRKFELTDYASGLESVEEECEECEGDGCAHCGWAGVVKRLKL